MSVCMCARVSEYMNNIVDANSHGILNIYTRCRYFSLSSALITRICNFVNKSKLHLASVTGVMGSNRSSSMLLDIAVVAFVLIDGTRRRVVFKEEQRTKVPSYKHKAIEGLCPSASRHGNEGYVINFAVLKKIVLKEGSLSLSLFRH